MEGLDLTSRSDPEAASPPRLHEIRQEPDPPADEPRVVGLLQVRRLRDRHPARIREGQALPSRRRRAWHPRGAGFSRKSCTTDAWAPINLRRSVDRMDKHRESRYWSNKSLSLNTIDFDLWFSRLARRAIAPTLETVNRACLWIVESVPNKS